MVEHLEYYLFTLPKKPGCWNVENEIILIDAILLQK